METTPGPQGFRKASQQEILIGRALQNGEYHIEAVLGNGGMGQVFLASYTKIDAPVALKQVRADQPLPESVIIELDTILHNTEDALPYVPPSTMDFPLSGGVNTDRFLREALLLARLRHPAIPLLYDYFFEDGYWYLAMEYVPGPTLANYMRDHTPLPPLEALNYTMQICDVLNYLHSQTPPVIFRDLKPSNTILNPDGRLMLVDFGIARYFKEGQVNDTTDFGSPGYASPEQYEGVGQTDARSDLFSLGVILHEMVSGRRPVRKAARNWQLEMLHTINAALSPALSGLVLVATRSEAMYRFQSAHTFYRALERVHRVEERWAYRRYTFLLEEARRQGINTAEKSITIQIPPEIKELPFGLYKTQRMHARAHSQEIQRKQLEQEALAHQLAFVDESLKQRLTVPAFFRNARLTPNPTPRLSSSLTPRPALTPGPVVVSQEQPFSLEEARSSLPQRSRQTRSIFNGLLVLLVLLTLLAGSVLTYNHYTSRSTPIHNLRITQAPTMPLQRPTPTRTPTSSSWRFLPSLPSPEADNTAMYTRVRGRAYIYMSGGYRGPTAPYYNHGLYRYDIAAAHWETLAISGFPGMGNNAAAVDEQGNLFFTAGYSPDTSSIPSLLYLYQPGSGTLHTITPPAQMFIGFGGAMIADQQGHLYLTEGFESPGNPATQAGTGWYRYDIGARQWRQLASLPSGLGYVQLALDGQGGILLLGGANDAGQRQPQRHVYRYDIQQNVWTETEASTPTTLTGAEGCVDRPGQFVVIGGYDAIHHRSLNQAWSFNLETFRWQSLPRLPGGGSVLGAAACDGMGHVYVMRGANNPNQPTADFFQLTVGG